MKNSLNEKLASNHYLEVKWCQFWQENFVNWCRNVFKGFSLVHSFSNFY